MTSLRSPEGCVAEGLAIARAVSVALPDWTVVHKDEEVSPAAPDGAAA
jgi:hypothetical protein